MDVFDNGFHTPSFLELPRTSSTYYRIWKTIEVVHVGEWVITDD